MLWDILNCKITAFVKGNLSQILRGLEADATGIADSDTTGTATAPSPLLVGPETSPSGVGVLVTVGVLDRGGTVEVMEAMGGDWST